MSEYYIPKRTKNLYVPGGKYSFKLSRSKLEAFMNCPRCFYMDRRLGVGQPPGFPFNLNSAVDFLLKKEFDIHRAGSTQHPLQESYGIRAVPYFHPDLDIWRENFKGIEFLHKPTNLIIGGAVDDLWINEAGELIVVDYKSTAKDGEVNIDAEWQRSYKNQMEIYQWLFRQNGFQVSNTGYFVYCNGKRDAKAFDAKLEFDIKLIPYEGKTDWVEGIIEKAYHCLNGELPEYTKTCDYCNYKLASQSVEGGSEAVVQKIIKQTVVTKKVKKPTSSNESPKLF